MGAQRPEGGRGRGRCGRVLRALALHALALGNRVRPAGWKLDAVKKGVAFIKAPVFGLAIAMIGCFEGMKVEGSAESVGQRTTASVVEGILPGPV